MTVDKRGLPEKFFARQDESPDEDFYTEPRFTTHIDDTTITALTRYYREVLSPSDRILDLMSSWISHLPHEVRYRHVAGHGMNTRELEANSRLDEFCVRNLNADPTLPWANAAFDAVLIAVSIQYLTRPFEVFAEIARVLAPGGNCIVAISHRLFPTKAIYAFQVLPPVERCQLIATYMDSTACLAEIEILDRSPVKGDPLWIVRGERTLV